MTKIESSLAKDSSSKGTANKCSIKGYQNPYVTEQQFSGVSQIKQNILDKKSQQSKVFMQSSSRKGPAEVNGVLKKEEKLISHFARQQLEQERHAERIMAEESEALQEYHRLLQREIEKLRIISNGHNFITRSKQNYNSNQTVPTNMASPAPAQRYNNTNQLKQTVQNTQATELQRLALLLCSQCNRLKNPPQVPTQENQPASLMMKYVQMGMIAQHPSDYCRDHCPAAAQQQLESQAESLLVCRCHDNKFRTRSESPHKELTQHRSDDNGALPVKEQINSTMDRLYDLSLSSQLQSTLNQKQACSKRVLSQKKDKDATYKRHIKMQKKQRFLTDDQPSLTYFESPNQSDLTRLEQLKLMQIQLLSSYPRSKPVQLGIQSGTISSNHESRKKTRINNNTIGDDHSLMTHTIHSTSSKSKQDISDLKHLKNVIKSQVIKFYQNNLVHGNRQKAIECKGQTIGGLILSQPLGCTLQEARKQQQAAGNECRKLSTIARPTIGPVSIQHQQFQQSSPPANNVMLKLPTELQLLALNDRKLRTKTKSSSNMLKSGAKQALNSLQRRNTHQRASIELDYELSEHRRVPRSDVNLFFHQINEFVRVTLKFKETITQAHLAQIRRLGRQIGLKFGNVKELDAKFINSKDFVAILKSKIFCMLNAVVMRASDPGATPVQSELQQAQKTYKFYVEPSGNNHQVVRSVIKRRSWYSAQELSQEHGWSGQGPKMLNLIWTQIRRPRILRELQPYQIYNHVDGINEIAQKSLLFLNMQVYYAARGLNVFDYMPETYLIPSTSDFEHNAQFRAFRQACEAAQSQGQLWIFKPGESTNRGHGIRVFNDYEKIRQHMQDYCRHTENRRGRNRNCIIQRYIMRPLLINRRKFDIRVFALVVAHAETGLLRGYFYEEGYLRTSSKDFNIEKWDNRLIHLTNDAVQKHSADYGKYESANKISYHDFDKHLLKEKNVSFLQTIVPRIKDMATDVLEATGRSLYRPPISHEGVSRSESAVNYNGFELLGFDFMLDSNLKLHLIEVNTNPCLDTPCMLLQRIIPTVLDQTLKIAVDPLLQANEHQYYMTQDLTVSEMRFQLVYQDSMELSRRDQTASSDERNNNKYQQKSVIEAESNKPLTPCRIRYLASETNLSISLTDPQASKAVMRSADIRDKIYIEGDDQNTSRSIIMPQNQNQQSTFKNQSKKSSFADDTIEVDEKSDSRQDESAQTTIRIQPNPNEPQ